jgi:hypothetical protein
MTKTSCILILALGFSFSYAFSQGEKAGNKPATDTISVDSIEYELIVIDPGFETWLYTKPPMEFYSKEYYASMNRLYVSEWNYRYSTLKNHGEYDSYIDYEPETDYGLELNYKLYYYFKYFEEKHRTKLYPSFR